MEATELRRLIVRHRHVAPMLSVLLAGTDARVTVTDAAGGVILDRQPRSNPGAASDPGGAPEAGAAPIERHPIVVEGDIVGWVDGPRPSGAVAAVLSYACAREADKRALAREALDRYRELNLIYDLADEIGATLEVDAVARVGATEAGRLPSGGTGFVLLRAEDDPDRLVGRPADEAPAIADAPAASGILGAVLAGDPEIVNDIAADPRASDAERTFASVVAAPLRVRGERIGVIGALSRDRLDFSASDLRLLTAIASLAGPTFEQAAVHATALEQAALRPSGVG